VFVSVRTPDDRRFGDDPVIVDTLTFSGPANGILSAMKTAPDKAWLVLGCDLPLITSEVLSELIAARDPRKTATAYKAQNNGLPEPLCAIYEPGIFNHMMAFIEAGRTCPRKMLIEGDVKLITLSDPNALDNANSPEDRIRMEGLIGGTAGKDYRVRYFAAMKDAAGKSTEEIRTYARTAKELYEELNGRYHFPLRHDLVKVAVNGSFQSDDVLLNAGDEIVFIPPVAGG
jgi:molybdopterin-guanine dinucleotide biosynthesis protein A